MKTKIKKRKPIHHHSAWRNDADFLDKLSPKDREYYLKFIDEYYRCDKDDGTPVHPADAKVTYDTEFGPRTGTYKQEAIHRQNQAFRDVVTQTEDRVTKVQSKPLKRTGGHSQYSIDDYLPKSVDPEQAMIDRIDGVQDDET